MRLHTSIRMAGRTGPGFLASLALLLAICALPSPAHAHALLQSSTPAAHATVPAGVVPIVLTYNSRVDPGHSALSLVKDGTAQPLVLDQHAAANVLRTKTPALKPGEYILRWQAVANDGHISRGQFAFEVK